MREYRKLSKSHHPDKPGGSTEMQQKLNTCKDLMLRMSSERLRYDPLATDLEIQELIKIIDELVALSKKAAVGLTENVAEAHPFKGLLFGLGMAMFCESCAPIADAALTGAIRGMQK